MHADKVVVHAAYLTLPGAWAMFTIASLEVSSGQQAVAQHEHSPASSIPEGANSVRVTFNLVVGHPNVGL